MKAWLSTSSLCSESNHIDRGDQFHNQQYSAASPKKFDPRKEQKYSSWTKAQE